MSEAYSASDYAGLNGGAYSFYYGYEKTNDDDDWLFIAKVSGTEVARWTAAEIGEDAWEPRRVLMAGIAKFLESVSLDQSPR